MIEDRNHHNHHAETDSQIDLLTGAVWRTSSYSGTQGNCVEVATNLPGLVAVRDSKDPGGPMLVFAAGEWAAFVGPIKIGS